MRHIIKEKLVQCDLEGYMQTFGFIPFLNRLAFPSVDEERKEILYELVGVNTLITETVSRIV